MNNRFCRCCFSDHNADDTICRGFLSHFSDNKHSLSSQRSEERPPGQHLVPSPWRRVPQQETPQLSLRDGAESAPGSHLLGCGQAGSLALARTTGTSSLGAVGSSSQEPRSLGSPGSWARRSHVRVY